MRKLLIGIAAVVGLVVAAILLLPALVPKQALVDRVQAEVERRTGRALTVAGPVDISILPNLAVTVGKVKFAGLPGGPDLLALERLELRLALLPLLSGRAEVQRFVLDRPVIELAVDKAGRANWQLEKVAGDGARQAPAEGRSGSAPVDLALGDIEIVDGRLVYSDARSGTRHALDRLRATITGASADAPLTLASAFQLDATPVTANLRFAPFRNLTTGEPADLAMDVKAAGAAIDLKGRFDRPAGGAPRLDGTLAVAISSLPELLHAVAGGRNKEGGATKPPFEKVDLTSKLAGSPTRLALSGMSLKLDEIAATGEVTADVAGSRPSLAGKLRFQRLDLDRFLPPPAPAVPPASGPPPPAGNDTGKAAPPSPGWSRDPVDLTALRLADLDLDLHVDGVTAAKVEAGPTNLAVELRGGRLKARLADTAIFGGKVGGSADLDASAASPAWHARARLAGVQAEPLLARFANFTRLTGTTEGEVDLRAAGASVDAWMRSLDGGGKLVFRDGAVKGVNLAQLVRSVTGTVTEGPQQTDFAEMGASFQVADGLATTQDFRLLAPLLRVAGGGKVSLPEKRVDMRIVPTLVANLEGQGAASRTSRGLTIPILVRGGFDSLSFTPDVAGLAEEAIRDPGALKDKLQGAKDALKGAKEGVRPEKAVEGLLKGFLGGGSQPPNPPKPPGQ